MILYFSRDSMPGMDQEVFCAILVLTRLWCTCVYQKVFAHLPLPIWPGAPVGKLELGASSPREPLGFFVKSECPLFLPRCCWKGSLPGSKSGLLSNTQKLSEMTYALTKKETLLGRGTQAESSRVRGPRRTALPRGLKSRVLRWGG